MTNNSDYVFGDVTTRSFYEGNHESYVAGDTVTFTYGTGQSGYVSVTRVGNPDDLLTPLQKAIKKRHAPSRHDCYSRHRRRK